MRKKTRAPGAGRKPLDPSGTAIVPIRIHSDLLRAINRLTKRSRRNRSDVIRAALNYWVGRRQAPERSKHIRALGEAVMLVAQYIERATGERWIDDAFTAVALRQGCSSLIAHFAPRGTPVTPRLIKEAATRHAQHIARVTGVRVEAAIPDAASTGETNAGKVIAAIESWNRDFRTLKEIQEINQAILESDVPEKSEFPEIWYTHANILRDLGSGWKRAQERGKRR